MPVPISALVHQGFQPFPNLDAPIANPDLTVSIPWYQLFITMWNRTGGAGGGTSLTSTTPGGSPQVVTLTQSPYLHQVSEGGVLLVTRKYTVIPSSGVRTREAGGETIELNRGGTGFYLAGYAPTALPVSTLDQVRVTWFTTNPPTVVFFPIA